MHPLRADLIASTSLQSDIIVLQKNFLLSHTFHAKTEKQRAYRNQRKHRSSLPLLEYESVSFGGS